jgi:hypothetical protein
MRPRGLGRIILDDEVLSTVSRVALVGIWEDVEPPLFVPF